MSESYGLPSSERVSGFTDSEQLSKKPSRIQVWHLRQVRKDINLGRTRHLSRPSVEIFDSLTVEDTRALAWLGDVPCLLFLSTRSFDPQTLAIIARVAEEVNPTDADFLRTMLAENMSASAETLDYLSTFIEYTTCADLAAHPNTPDEALLRICYYPYASTYIQTILDRRNISVGLAVKVAVRAKQLGIDAYTKLSAVICRELKSPIGFIVAVEAADQLHCGEVPAIEYLTDAARTRTAGWDTRTVAALEALYKNTNGLDGETLCSAAEELAASRQAPLKMGEPNEKAPQNIASQAI